MTFTSAHNGGNCLGCVWIAAEGPITTQTPQDFLAFLEEDGGEGVSVYLNSSGGNLIAGMELGKLIREKGYSTQVAKTTVDLSLSWGNNQYEIGECLSSCAYAFLGGVERKIDAPFEGDEERVSALGFHQFENIALKADNLSEAQRKLLDDQVMSMAQVLSGIVVGYVMDMGVDPRIIAKAAEARPDGMVYPERKLLSEYNVITDGGYGSWNLEPYRDGLLVTAAQTNLNAAPRQATGYCRKSDGARILMISSTGKLGEAPPLLMTDNILYKKDSDGRFSGQSGAKLTIGEQDIRIPKTSVETYDGGGANSAANSDYFHYRVLMDDNQVGMLKKAAAINLAIYTSRASGYHWFISDMSDRERQMLSLAWRNCI